MMAKLTKNIPLHQETKFMEILPDENDVYSNLPDTVETYVSSVDPKLCGKLLKELGYVLPLPKRPQPPQQQSITFDVNTVSGGDTQDGKGNIGTEKEEEDDESSDFVWPSLGHLRRVRRIIIKPTDINCDDIPVSTEVATENGDKRKECHDCDAAETDQTRSKKEEEEKEKEGGEPSKKRKKRKQKRQLSHPGSSKPAVQLEVLLGSIAHVDSILGLNFLEHGTAIQIGNGSMDTSTENQSHSSQVAPALGKMTTKQNLQRILAQYNLHLQKRILPGRPARSQKELDEWNGTFPKNSADKHCKSEDQSILDTYQPERNHNDKSGGWWPTIYYPKQTQEYKRQSMALTGEEVRDMEWGMKEAFLDAKSSYCDKMEYLRKSSRWMEQQRNEGGKQTTVPIQEELVAGAVVICPVTKTVVSMSCQERRMQLSNWMRRKEDDSENDSTNHKENNDRGGEGFAFLDNMNPLCTPILLAIQGVSRKERKAATGYGMDSELFQTGQVRRSFLCFLIV